jgi:hypothetical protein
MLQLIFDKLFIDIKYDERSSLQDGGEEEMKSDIQE